MELDHKRVFHSYRILETLRRVREARNAEAHAHVTQLVKGASSVPHSQPSALQPLSLPASHTVPPNPSPQASIDPSPARQLKKSETLPISSENSRSTPTPHPAINQLQAPPSTSSPPVNSRSPLPANPYQAPAGTPMPAHSPAQRGYTQSPRPSSAQASHSSPLASGSQISTVDHRQPPVGMHFIQVAPGASQSKPATPQVGYTSLPTPSPQQAVVQQATQIPQPPQPQPQATHPTVQANMAAMYMQRHNQGQGPQAQVQAQVRAQNGRATPQSAALARSPMISAPTTAARNSPVVQNQPLAARSPMPNTTSLPQQMTQPAMTQPTMAQPAMAQPAQHSAMAPAYYAQFRPIPHAATAQHPQLQVHMQQGPQPNITAPQVSDPQQAMMVQYPQMYSYYPVAHGRRIPPAYAWPGMGRGMPNQVNGQTPGMQPGLPQQMQVAQGKTTQAGVPGR